MCNAMLMMILLIMITAIIIILTIMIIPLPDRIAGRQEGHGRALLLRGRAPPVCAVRRGGPLGRVPSTLRFDHRKHAFGLTSEGTAQGNLFSYPTLTAFLWCSQDFRKRCTIGQHSSDSSLPHSGGLPERQTRSGSGSRQCIYIYIYIYVCLSLSHSLSIHIIYIYIYIYM